MFNRFLHNGLYFDESADKGGTPPTTPPDGTPPGQAGAGDGDKKSFTQAELDALFGARAKQAAEKATSDLLTSLGVKSPDEIKTALAKAKELEDAQLSELDKAKRLVETEKARADAAEKLQAEAMANANEKLLRAEILAEASKQGFRDEAVSDVWLVLTSDAKLKEQVKAGEEGFEGIESVVKAIAKGKPHWLKSNPKENINAGNQNQNANGALTDEQRRELAAIYGVKPEYITPAR